MLLTLRVASRIEARCRTSSRRRNPRERHLTRGNATRQFPRCARVRNDGRPPPPRPAVPFLSGMLLPALEAFPMSAEGQTEKNSARAYIFRFALCSVPGIAYSIRKMTAIEASISFTASWVRRPCPHGIGLWIEIQLRTSLQHAWATVVETVDAFTNENLKFGAGSDDWKRFFN